MSDKPAGEHANFRCLSETSSFRLETNRSDIDLKKIKNLKNIKRTIPIFSCRTENTSVTLCRTHDHKKKVYIYIYIYKTFK